MTPFRRFTAPTLLALTAVSCANPSGPSDPPPVFTSAIPATSSVAIATGQSVTFEVEAESPTGGTIRYEFRVDGDLVANAPSFVFAPGDSGRYRIEAAASDGQRAATRAWTVMVTTPPNVAPSITFTVSMLSGEAPLPVTARVIGTDPDGVIVSTTIDFNDDGTTESSSANGELEASFSYPSEGSYTARATVRDDKGATATTSATINVLRPNATPTGTLTVSETSGDAPLAVTLRASGFDPDGQIVKWEIDLDDGRGFVDVPEFGVLDVVYPFRESEYRPRLRLTDDRNKVAIVEAPDVAVYRPIDTELSSTSATGDPRFDAFPSIAPAIWADGEYRLRFTVRVRDGAGNAISGVPVRVTSLRPHLIAPDGTDLGGTLAILLDRSTTDDDGVLTGAASTRTSGRVFAVPNLGAFVPFALRVEAHAGHDDWRLLGDIAGLNAETTVSEARDAGDVQILPYVACAGQEREIRVRAISRPDSPSPGSTVKGVYVDIRDNSRKVLEGLRPAPGYNNWRTDEDGWIGLRVTPENPGGWIILAWVDGVPLTISSLLFVNDC